jgi:hypothetical protein
VKTIEINVSESFSTVKENQKKKSLEESFASAVLKEIEIRRRKLKGKSLKPTTKKV